jgi:hypothetical protein
VKFNLGLERRKEESPFKTGRRKVPSQLHFDSTQTLYRVRNNFDTFVGFKKSLKVVQIEEKPQSCSLP